MTKSYVSYGTSVNKGARHLAARLTIDGAIASQKQASIETHGAELAYEIIELWAVEKAKEHGVEIRKIPLNRLLNSLNSNAKRKNTSHVPTQLNRKKIETHFRDKATVRELVTLLAEIIDIDKLKGFWDSGFNEIDKIRKERRAKEQAETQATTILAQSMYRAYKATGIDMSETINDKRAKELYLAYVSGDKDVVDEQVEEAKQLPLNGMLSLVKVAERYDVPEKWLIVFHEMISKDIKWMDALRITKTDKNYKRGRDMYKGHGDYVESRSLGGAERKVEHHLTEKGEELYGQLKKIMG